MCHARIMKNLEQRFTIRLCILNVPRRRINEQMNIFVAMKLTDIHSLSPRFAYLAIITLLVIHNYSR